MLATMWNPENYRTAHALILCLLFVWLTCCVGMTVSAFRHRSHPESVRLGDPPTL